MLELREGLLQPFQDGSTCVVCWGLQATQAYLVGNKALAKELGGKGREHSDQMKAAHAAASENIFQQRNLRTTAAAVQNKNGEHSRLHTALMEPVTACIELRWNGWPGPLHLLCKFPCTAVNWLCAHRC